MKFENSAWRRRASTSMETFSGLVRGMLDMAPTACTCRSHTGCLRTCSCRGGGGPRCRAHPPGAYACKHHAQNCAGHGAAVLLVQSAQPSCRAPLNGGSHEAAPHSPCGHPPACTRPQQARLLSRPRITHARIFFVAPQVLSSLRKDFSVSAQNCWVKAGGAFTGELRWACLLVWA